MVKRIALIVAMMAMSQGILNASSGRLVTLQSITPEQLILLQNALNRLQLRVRATPQIMKAKKWLTSPASNNDR